jgi:hypothetical protein
MKWLAAFIVSVAFIPAANASVLKAVPFSPDEKNVMIYDGACGEEERGECVVAALYCENGAFQIVVSASDKDLAGWFSRGIDKFPVTGFEGLSDLSARSIERNELNGDWDVTFQTGVTPSGLAKGASHLILKAPTPVDLPLDNDARTFISELISSCK